MRRVDGRSGNIFRPKGQLVREMNLARQSAAEVVRILGERLSSDRKERIDRVVDHRTGRLAVAIDGVHDPHNTGAVIRTADAFGIQQVHIIDRSDTFLSSRRVTQGSHKWVDLAVWRRLEEFLETMRSQKKKIWVADAEATASLDEVDGDEPVVLVFGNEHDGVGPEIRATSDGSFSIPTQGFARSLNVSVAAAVAVAALRRGGKGDLSPEESLVLRARFYLRAVRSGYLIALRELDRPAAL